MPGGAALAAKEPFPTTRAGELILRHLGHDTAYANAAPLFQLFTLIMLQRVASYGSMLQSIGDKAPTCNGPLADFVAT